MGDSGKKDKGKKERQKKAQLSPKEKRRLKKDKKNKQTDLRMFAYAESFNERDWMSPPVTTTMLL